MSPERLAAIRWRHINVSVPYTGGKDIAVDDWMNQADHDLGELLGAFAEMEQDMIEAEAEISDLSDQLAMLEDLP